MIHQFVHFNIIPHLGDYISKCTLNIAFDSTIALLEIYPTEILGHVCRELSIKIKATMLCNVRLGGSIFNEAMSIVPLKYDRDFTWFKMESD